MSLVLENIGLKPGSNTITHDVSLTVERGAMNVLLRPTPRGSLIIRGGDANSPAAVYATTKFVEWLNNEKPQGETIDYDELLKTRATAPPVPKKV